MSTRDSRVMRWRGRDYGLGRNQKSVLAALQCLDQLAGNPDVAHWHALAILSPAVAMVREYGEQALLEHGSAQLEPTFDILACESVRHSIQGLERRGLVSLSQSSVQVCAAERFLVCRNLFTDEAQPSLEMLPRELVEMLDAVDGCLAALGRLAQSCGRQDIDEWVQQCIHGTHVFRG